jgi:DNA processing protein
VARAAVVGTRHPEAGVCARVQALAAELAEAGACIVSGAAEGVDQAAHAGALEAGGQTWAFLGEGIDRLAGARSGLAAAMRSAGGTLFSQYPPGTPASKSTFRRRNPLISGAADAVLVARAPLASGALITAEAAWRQGRPLLAIPGDPWNPRAAGGNELLRRGQASLCLGAAEVLGALGLEAPPARASHRRLEPVSAEAARLLELVEPGAADLDQLAARAGLEAGQVSALLVELELAGHLAQRGGGRYRRLGAGLAGQSNVDAGGAAI